MNGIKDIYAHLEAVLNGWVATRSPRSAALHVFGVCFVFAAAVAWFLLTIDYSTSGNGVGAIKTPANYEQAREVAGGRGLLEVAAEVYHLKSIADSLQAMHADSLLNGLEKTNTQNLIQ